MKIKSKSKQTTSGRKQSETGKKLHVLYLIQNDKKLKEIQDELDYFKQLCDVLACKMLIHERKHDTEFRATSY